LSVADTGKGIDPKFIGQVFDRFKQADTSSARHTGGLGLGLALVKELVAMHGGTVEAESPGLGFGSTFSVHLPHPVVETNRTAAGPVAHAGAATLAGVSVLVIDDDADAREIAQRTITDAGGTAVTAGNATEALAALASGVRKVDALVSDIGLPGTDGYDLLSAVRALPSDRGQMPAIAVTAYASEADAKKARDHGFAAHVSKPYVPADLVAAIHNAIERPR
jgi:CheY-like chemotaxis protein